MKILVLGGGGREHALAWKAVQGEGVSRVYVAPGNAGTALEPGVENVSLDVCDFAGLEAFVQEKDVALTIVGPEAPLVAGICDYFSERGLACFGPSKGAAQLEGSKAFSKQFLQRHAIPTADFETFTEVAPACDYIRRRGAPIVVKADGLAAGKGVVVASTVAEAEAAVKDMLAGNAFGTAGSKVVIEAFLSGEEASFICLCDGVTALPFASSQDHKARDDGDLGPNTGGMGAYSPAPVVSPEVHQRIMDEVIKPTLAGMARDGYPYVGFLYAGLMIDATGQPRVIEFNCRFGDPEAQPVLMRLDSDLPALCRAALSGELEGLSLQWDTRPALGVVMAAGGYPASYAKGAVISGLETRTDPNLAHQKYPVKVFHAGTKLNRDGQVVTDGGRVLCVVALGETVTEAAQRAYRRVAEITWQNAYYRKDIGYRAIAREQELARIKD